MAESAHGPLPPGVNASRDARALAEKVAGPTIQMFGKLPANGLKHLFVNIAKLLGRAIAPQKLATIAKKTMSNVTIISDIAEAARHAIETAGRDDVVCIAGSLYVVGEVKEAIEKGLLKSIRKT